MPYNLSTYSVNATSATLYWYASSYTSLEYRYKTTSSATWITVTTTQNGSINLTGLTPSTAYEWQVRSLCTGGETSGFTASTNFTTTACNAPTSASTDNITHTSARLRWYDVDRTNNYTVSYRVGAGAWQTIPNIPGDGTNTTIYYTLTGLTNGSTYQWAVQKACTGTISSPFSTTQNFTAACNTPTSVYPGTVRYNQAILNWSSYGPATTYNIQYKAGLAGTFQTISNVASTTTGTTSYTLTGLTPNTTYYFQVQTNCGGGTTSPYSATSSFTTQCFTPSTYVNTVGSVTAEIQPYNSSNDASTLYNIEYTPQPGGTPVIVSNVTSPYTLTALTANVTYRVRSQAVCAPGVTSAYSTTTSFSTSCRALDNNTSISTITSKSAELRWYDPDNTSTYEVQYRTTSPTVGTFQSVTGIVGSTSSYKAYSLTGLTNNTAYEWMVRKVCGNVSSLTFTTPRSFTTQCGTTNSAYAIYNTVTYNSAGLSWYTNEIGTPHELQYRPQNSGTWQSVSNITGTSSLYSYTLTGLDAGTTYVTQVRAVCGAGATSPFSSTTSFATQSCAGPTSLAVSNITSTSALLNWYSDYYNPAGTTMEVSYTPASQSATGPWTVVSSLTATYTSFSYSLTGLTPNTDYAWRVRSFCTPTGSSSYVTGPIFRVECRIPDNPSTYSITFNSASLGWNGSSGQTYEVQYRQQGSTSAFTSVTTTFSSYQLQNISGSYEWKVRTICGAYGTSAFAPLQIFSTVCSPPSSRYTSNISSYGAILQWNNAGNGTRYTIQYRQQGTTPWTQVSDIGGTMYALPGLANATTYEFQVQSVCSPSVSSTFSASTQFTTSCPTPTVTLSSGLSNGSPQIYWTPTYGVGYVVEWKTRASATWDNTSPVLNELSFSNSGSSISANSVFFTITGLSPSTTYDYRVRTICADGNTSNYTPVQSLTTVSCNPAVPTTHNSSPSFNLASLSWSTNVSTFGLSWELRWRPTGASTWNTTQALSSTSQTLRGLRGNTAYEWQVRSSCATGSPSAYGALQSFTTVCAQPTNLSALCITNSSVNLDWTGVSGATYELQWRAVGQPTWTTVSSLTTDAYRLTGLSANTAYEYQVRTICGASESTNFVGPVAFTTLSSCPVPTFLNAYNYNSDCGVYYLSWGGCTSSGTTYEVQYKLQSSGTWQTATTTTNTNYTLAGLVSSTAYDVRVRTVCPGGSTSDFVTAQFVSVGCVSNCLPPTSLATQDITNAAATAVWFGSNSQSYEFRWRAGYSTNWTTTSTFSGYRMTGLNGDTPYEWQVRNVCTNGQSSEYSLINFFRTVCNIPLNPNSFNVGATSATLSWNGFSSGVQYEIRYRVGAGAWQTVSSIGTENYNLAGLSNNTTYEWQVKTLCSGGGGSNFSHSLFFTTQCAMPTNAYSQFIDLTSAQLVWNGPTGTTYELQYRPVGGTYTTVSVGNVTSYTLTGLNNGTAYEWQVRTLCSGGSTSGYPTQPLTFQTVSSACAAMFTTQPGNWNNASIWSCGRVPNATDNVEVRHAVNVTGTSNNALIIRFTAQGGLTYSEGASLRLGF
ncbi:hypothetical protein GCM10028807_27480 [Spirosoma daeguense]